MYNCVADNPDELTFTEGEVIVVDGEEDQEWWVSINPFLLILRTSSKRSPPPSRCVTTVAGAESHDLTLADALFPTATKKAAAASVKPLVWMATSCRKMTI